MKRRHLFLGAALVLTSGWALAQNGPESLLPKGFDEPAAPAGPAAQSGPRASSGVPTPKATSTPVVQPLPGMPPITLPGEGTVATAPVPTGILSRVPTLAELVAMTPQEFEALLGARAQIDMPPGAKRSLDTVGLIDESEGGLPAPSLAAQNPSLVRVALQFNKGTLVSRWGHILLRRALASRLQAPAGMDPAEFSALRVGLLLRMGEGDAARALLQDVDIANYTPIYAPLALDVYQRTADFTGLCPVTAVHGEFSQDVRWDATRAICEAFRGNAMAGLSRLDKMQSRGRMPRIDTLLAQKYAGAAGKARRAVTIEWKEASDMTPWRYGLAIGVGLEPPKDLMAKAGRDYDFITATAPMVGLERRAAAADRAAGAGVLSTAAMVDLYSQIYSAQDITGSWQDLATSLRDSYAGNSPADRLAAMQALWSGAGGPITGYGRKVLTAAAAARIPAEVDLADNAAPLIASMLAAGYDANAMRWAPVVNAGSEGWALLALASPISSRTVDTGAIDTFAGADESGNRRKSAFLIAGLAGLGRLGDGDVQRYSSDMALKLDSTTRFTQAIDSAAARGDQASVALLAGFGMQGRDWGGMTPRYLFHIVSALNRVGLGAEARMIAAEAVARA
ncbi:hypothetical protein [Novosphingobium colocasiae]|uniref:hypothetical protein n=1 Tax=Novosphingobium colocasiae TaxID=1256513 RepID=UPI0035AFB085